MAIFNRILKGIVKKIDDFVINHLTVERGPNKRKFIWKTKNFREITQLYVPKLIFLGFVVVMCWKINDKVKKLKHGESNYTAKSRRQVILEEEEKVEYILI